MAAAAAALTRSLVMPADSRNDGKGRGVGRRGRTKNRRRKRSKRRGDYRGTENGGTKNIERLECKGRWDKKEEWRKWKRIRSRPIGKGTEEDIITSGVVS